MLLLFYVLIIMIMIRCVPSQCYAFFVLFDSAASLSIVSLVFRNNFDIAMGALDHSCLVEIEYDYTFRASCNIWVSRYEIYYFKSQDSLGTRRVDGLNSTC